jgi:uncharacterized protein YgiM (DUF1202 family)
MFTLLFLTFFNAIPSPKAINPKVNSVTYITTTSDKVLNSCYITGTNVRMRETPSLQGRILGTFRYYESVEVIRWSNDSNWCRVRRSNGMTGWVYGDYIGDCEGGDR